MKEKNNKGPIPPGLIEIMNERVSVLDFIKSFSRGIAFLEDHKAGLEAHYFKIIGKLPPAEKDHLTTIICLVSGIITELGSVLPLEKKQMNSLVEYSLGLIMELRKIHAQKKTQ